MGLNWAEHTVEIAAPIETCFEAITDYETFPSWQGAVVSTEVIDREKSGLGRRVKLVVDAKVRKVDYTLDYRYDRPERIEWDFVEGNGINDADGHYLFEKLDDGRTRATYKFGLEVGIPLPGPVARRAHKQTLKGSVEDLKREAERRATASEGAKASSPKGLAGFGRRRPPAERERAAAPEEPTAERPAAAEA
ncbi:MAG: SRPBCC family protein, partial [Solirubrobacterales bacterium]